MKIGLVGPSYQMFSLPFDAQRTVNLFPALDEMGKEVSSLFMTPGLEEFAVAGVGATRGAFTSAANGRCFFVSGSNLYEISSNGVVTSRGSLNQSSGNVTMAENGTQLAICDGVTLYIFTYGTNAFAQVSDSDFPGAGSVCFLNGYFIVNKPNTGQFYISALYDGLVWAALDFATAESTPDSLLRVVTAQGQLWLLGSGSAEVWTNTGGSAGSSFPFRRISGAVIKMGIEAPDTALEMDNALFFLGRNEFGRGMVFRTDGFTPVKISTEAIDLKLQSVANLSDCVSYGYQENGHAFFVITGGGLETSLVYDLSTQLWHERAFLNPEGEFEQHLGYCYTYAFNKHLVGSRIDGKIYEMSMSLYDDAGDPILRERIYTHISNEDERIRFNNLDIGVETGVGAISGDSATPLISLRLSKDGARTWSNPYIKSFGALGQYNKKVTFRRLGIADIMTFRISISSAVKVAITGSYLK